MVRIQEGALACIISETRDQKKARAYRARVFTLLSGWIPGQWFLVMRECRDSFPEHAARFQVAAGTGAAGRTTSSVKFMRSTVDIIVRLLDIA